MNRLPTIAGRRDSRLTLWKLVCCIRPALLFVPNTRRDRWLVLLLRLEGYMCEECSQQANDDEEVDEVVTTTVTRGRSPSRPSSCRLRCRLPGRRGWTDLDPARVRRAEREQAGVCCDEPCVAQIAIQQLLFSARTRHKTPLRCARVARREGVLRMPPLPVSAHAYCH